MTLRIRVQGDLAHLSSADGAFDRVPCLTAVVEVRGGLLHGDPTGPASLPDADIDDVDAASAWLADVYGPETADAVIRGVHGATRIEPGDQTVIDAVLRLARLTWTRAWWPAGARVPAVDPVLLAAEIALAAHAVEHLLDDDLATERALADAAGIAPALAALPPALAAEGERLLSALTALSEDYGVALDPAEATAADAAQVRQEWALAAGGARDASDGIGVASGSAVVRWGDVPAQTVDAEAEARWTLRQSAGVATLRVEVPAVDAPSSGRTLAARFGPAELGVDVALRRDGALFRGEAEVPASALFLPAGERLLWVRDPLLSPADADAPDSAADRERVLSVAAARILSPDASLAERAAGSSR